MDIVWKDLSVSAASGRLLLEKISGFAHPGSITAILGPSGSGKSTMLDALAGRPATNAKMEGEIFLNGCLQSKLSTLGVAAYVTQNDILISALTVFETLLYSADLRLSETVPRQQKIEIVEALIAEMGLQSCRDSMIGNWHYRGISGGEKRRLSIALEILTRPALLFLDEPTSGLDSASAFFVTTVIRRLASRNRLTVILSIHQPSSEVFGLLDNVCLLSQGKLVYFGETVTAAEFFAQAGFPCPVGCNPSDHFLRTINADFDEIVNYVDPDHDAFGGVPATTSEKIESLQKTFETHWLSLVKAKVDVDESDQMVVQSDLPKVGASFSYQVLATTRRSFKNMRRDLSYYWLRIFVYFFLSAGIGSLYFRIGTKYDSIAARIGCMTFVGAFLTFMSIGGFPSFVEDMKVFNHELQNGYYGVLVFTLANTLSSAPFLLIISLGSLLIFYYLVWLHSGWSHFIYFVLNLFASLAVVESLMMFVASIVPNFLMGIITGAGIQGLFLLVSGFFRLSNDIPRALWRYPLHYVSFHTYLLQGLYENDFIGLEFENMKIGQPKLSGELVLKEVYQVDVSRSKWCNLGILFVMIFLYRAAFICIVWFKHYRISKNCTYG